MIKNDLKNRYEVQVQYSYLITSLRYIMLHDTWSQRFEVEPVKSKVLDLQAWETSAEYTYSDIVID